MSNDVIFMLPVFFCFHSNLEAQIIIVFCLEFKSETRSLRTWHEAEMSAVSVPLCLEHCLKNVKARVDA